MKVTIQKTLYLDEIPEEIDETFTALLERVIGARQILATSSQMALEGRYVDASEEMERLREVLAMIDKNIEEQQSLCLSYEKIRIANNMPHNSGESDG